MAKSADEGPYQVVARRFRPTRFEDVVGQEAIVQCLQSALAAKQVPHAFLFSGSRGVGKTTLARILARALNCESGPTPTPCDRCRACTSILAGTNPDVVEIDAASHNLVDDIRELRDRVGLASMGSRYKVYLLDEVHMLTRSAFNAFLKTLEEPPANVAFILATTELHKVPETIRSRCQVHLFRRIDADDITRRLGSICARERVAIPGEILADIAAASEGGMRDAEGALERLLPVAHGSAAGLDVSTYRQLAHRMGFDASLAAVAALLGGDASAALRFAADAESTGADEREALGEILEVLRALLMLAVDGAESPLVTQTGGVRARMLELVKSTALHGLEAAIHAGLQGRERMRRVDDRRLVLELTLLAMARAGSLPQLAELLEAARTQGPAPVVVEPAVATGPASTARSAAPTATPAAEPLDLRARLLVDLEKQQPLLARTIEQCAVRGPDPQDRVFVELQGDSRLHRDRLAADGVQRILSGALQRVVGRAVTLSISSPAPSGKAADAAAPKASTRAPDAGTARGRRREPPGPSVQKVVDRFDGRILDDDDPPPG